MGIINTVKGWFGGGVDEREAREAVEARSSRIDQLLSYYENRQPYDALRNVGGEPGVKALVSPGHRVGEFYASKLWNGPVKESFKVEGAEKDVEDAIHKAFEWGNWAQEKQSRARLYSVTGYMWLRASENDGRTRVFPEAVDAKDVTDHAEDERGNIVKLRLDVPKSETSQDGRTRRYTKTEVWDKELGSVRVWEHDYPKGTSIPKLGTPTEERKLTFGGGKDSAGVDFVPFVRAVFKNVDGRGMGAFEHALGKMDEANLLATKLHKMLFPKWPWVAEQTATDADGRPLPPPRFETQGASSTMDVGGEQVVRMPTGVTLKPAVPPIDFGSHLDALKAMLEELEKDLPELRYHKLNERGVESGRAIRYQLSDLVDKVLEARGNGLAAIEKVMQMVLTVGKNAGVEGFADLPDFEEDERAFTFSSRDPFPTTETEELEADGKRLELYERALRVMSPQEARGFAGLPEATEVPLNALPEVPVEQREGAQTAQKILGKVLGANGGGA